MVTRIELNFNWVLKLLCHLQFLVDLANQPRYTRVSTQHSLCKCVDQLCPTQMAYWTKNHVIISTRAAHFMTY